MVRNGNKGFRNFKEVYMLEISVAGVLWVSLWLASTVFVYMRNVVRLNESSQTKQGRYIWIESGELHRRELVSTQVVFRSEKNQQTAAPYKRQISRKLILFYNPSNFQIVRNLTNITYTFENCEVKNCRMSFDPYDANISDAVIFHWFRYKQILTLPEFIRPKNQVWIFIQHEPTRSYARNATLYPLYEPGMKHAFNWTMTYSKRSDIYLPYGKLVRKPKSETWKRDYLKIAKSKSRDAIWVVSQCNTFGKREEYVKILRQYIDVEILGACGTNWTCGVRSNHPLDNCFSILNTTYRYYLAFENDLCTDYVTEKFYENYEYDLLQVVRAGMPNKRPIKVEKDAYISASDFKNAHELGKYLRNLSSNVVQYAKMLAIKDKYKVITYQELFLDSMCDLCKRINNLNHSKFAYDDVYKWLRKNEPCYRVKDLS